MTVLSWAVVAIAVSAGVFALAAAIVGPRR
jgi:hypothetical protein